MFYTSQPSKTSAPTRLTPDHLNLALGLQNIVYNALPQEEKKFILPKSRGFLSGLFKRGSTMVGIMQGDELVAQAIIINPNGYFPDTGMVDMKAIGTPETSSVLQGVLVHPKARGHGLGSMLCKAWLKLCQENGRYHVMAETALPNVRSQSIFLKGGLPVISLGEDPEDGTIVCNHYTNLQSPKKYFNTAASETICLTKKDDLQCALASGMVAHSHRFQSRDKCHFVLDHGHAQWSI